MNAERDRDHAARGYVPANPFAMRRARPDEGARAGRLAHASLSRREPIRRAPCRRAGRRRRRRHGRAPQRRRAAAPLPEEANLRAPEAVVGVHLGFIRAGAELIETNTFGANRRKLAAHYLEDELEEIDARA